MALKGKQHKLDKNKDGKISGEDFKMMKKARVGKMIDDTEELGRVDAEKAYTAKGRKNLKEEKKRLVKEIKTEKARVGKIIKASQGYNARLDESLGVRNKAKSQTLKDRRNESKGMEKAMGKGAYSGASTMAKKGKMMKANKGVAVSTRGYGAARTSGMGLQDESLAPGQSYVIKGGDYIKDLL